MENENNTNVTNQDVVDNSTATDVSTDTTEATPTAEGGTQSVGIPIRYNHQDRVLTLEEATAYSQKGLKYDSLAPMLDDLSMLSAMRGIDSHELIKSLIKIDEDNKREEIMERANGDEEIAEILMNKYRDEISGKFKRISEAQADADKAEEAAKKETIESKIVDEFDSVRQEFPEFDTVDKLPKEVLEKVKGGESLFNAVLQHKHNVNKIAVAAKNKAIANSKASTGSVSGGEDDATLDAFLSAFK